MVGVTDAPVTYQGYTVTIALYFKSNFHNTCHLFECVVGALQRRIHIFSLFSFVSIFFMHSRNGIHPVIFVHLHCGNRGDGFFLKHTKS